MTHTVCEYLYVKITDIELVTKLDFKAFKIGLLTRNWNL